MALKVNYNFKGIALTDAYLKIENIRVSEFIENENKVYKAYVDYSLRVSKNSDILQAFSDVIIFDTENKAHTQLYTYLKTKCNGIDC
jgi:hypothetical protein